jgi:maltooligosyltrehalose trehalohydrolase
MGEEWGAQSPFPFFCDFHGELADAVREGRRSEFARFPAFSNPEVAARIPDPTAESTFLAAKLDWDHVDPDRLAFFRMAIAARRAYVRPLLEQIIQGGQTRALGRQAVRVTWTAQMRRLVLDANLSESRVAAPLPEATIFWRFGETEDQLGPWSVRWSIS